MLVFPKIAEKNASIIEKGLPIPQLKFRAHCGHTFKLTTDQVLSIDTCQNKISADLYHGSSLGLIKVTLLS